MGDFWEKYRLDNGRPMSLKQIQRIEQLEAEIAYHEHRVDECYEAINCIKRGGRKPVEIVNADSF